jgi:hypothetical protein
VALLEATRKVWSSAEEIKLGSESRRLCEYSHHLLETASRKSGERERAMMAEWRTGSETTRCRRSEVSVEFCRGDQARQREQETL